jgi:hypothetical protein
VGVVVGVDAAVVVGGLEGQQAMPPVMWDGGLIGGPGREGGDSDFVCESELLGCVSA